MRILKKIALFAALIFLMLGMTQCSTTRTYEKVTPIVINDAYFQSWVAGVEGGGSGINVYIKVEDSPVKLDSIYFRNRAVVLEVKPHDNALYIGRFAGTANQQTDMIIHLNPKKEFGNTMHEIPKAIPFELRENDCVISYRDGEKTKYFKIENLRREPSIPFPSAPIRKQ